MFRQQNVFAMITGFGVRVKDEREQNRNHQVEVDFELPLSYELADEILPAMATDLFKKIGDSMKPRPEMQEATFAISTKKQVLDIRVHPEVATDAAHIEGAELRKIKAVKGEGGAWLLRFTAYWTLAQAAEVILVIMRLKLGVYLTMQDQQVVIPLDTVDAQVVSEQEPTIPGTEAPNADGKKKKRGRRNPEAEKVAQIEEGRRKKQAKALPEPAQGATGPEEWHPDDPPGTVTGAQAEDPISNVDAAGAVEDLAGEAIAPEGDDTVAGDGTGDALDPIEDGQGLDEPAEQL